MVSPPEKKYPVNNLLNQYSYLENLVIITIDGFRWQEVFNGADSLLINDDDFTSNSDMHKLLYWGESPMERRKKLMPFMWNVIASRGQLWGNRSFNNEVNVTNLFGFSYPGYNELLTGTTDIRINSNRKIYNNNKNVLELLNEKDEYHNRVVAFSSWSLFPYILNRDRNNLSINSGYQKIQDDSLSVTEQNINTIQERVIAEKTDTRNDLITFIAAKEYIKKKHPKVVFISLGEADEFAHSGKYDLYLQSATKTDNLIADLWNYLQSDEVYKNKTNLLITTDHGRGYKFSSSWTRHGPFTPGSKNIWLAMMGPSIKSIGEVKEQGEIKQKNMVDIISHLLPVSGEEKNTGRSFASLPKQIIDSKGGKQ